MTKDMKIVDNCDPGTEYYSKGFKPEMLAPPGEVVNNLRLEKWYAELYNYIQMIIC